MQGYALSATSERLSNKGSAVSGTFAQGRGLFDSESAVFATFSLKPRRLFDRESAVFAT